MIGSPVSCIGYRQLKSDQSCRLWLPMRLRIVNDVSTDMPRHQIDYNSLCQCFNLRRCHCPNLFKTYSELQLRPFIIRNNSYDKTCSSTMEDVGFPFRRDFHSLINSASLLVTMSEVRTDDVPAHSISLLEIICIGFNVTSGHFLDIFVEHAVI